MIIRRKSRRGTSFFILWGSSVYLFILQDLLYQLQVWFLTVCHSNAIILFHQYFSPNVYLNIPCYLIPFSLIFSFFSPMPPYDLVVLSLFWISRRFSYWILNAKPNFQSILIRIIQMLHYYCRNQHKNIENSQII